jgi:hypothetical protein
MHKKRIIPVWIFTNPNFRTFSNQLLHFRHYQYEQKLARLLWKVDYKDILTLPEEMDGSPYNYNERVTPSNCLFSDNPL